MDKLVGDVKSEMQLLLKQYEALYQTGSSNSIGRENDVASSRSSKNSWMAKFEKSRGVGEQSFGKKSELERYLTDDVEGKSDAFDILQWWKANSTRYPILSKMAKDILAIPISSVTSESAFSTGARVVKPHRSSLSPQIVEALICTQDWIRMGRKRLDETEDSEKFNELAKDIFEKIESMGLE